MKTLLGMQTHFSFHWGTTSPRDWMARAKAMGYQTLGFADQAGLHGYPEMLKGGEAAGVRPLCGASFPFSDGRSVIAFAETPPGYGNLCERITDWQAGFAARPPACAGGVPALDPEEGRKRFLTPALLDGLVFIADDLPVWRALRAMGAECYWRIGPTLAAPPREVDPGLLVFAPGPPLLAPGDFATHRLLRAIGAGITLDRIPEAGAGEASPVLLAPPEHWLRPPEEYADLFAVYAGAMARADELGERLAAFAPNTDIHCPPVPGENGDAPGDHASALARLRRLAYEGAAIRYGSVTDEVRERLEQEFAVIEQREFAEYFLVVHDIVNNLAGGDGRVRRGRSVTCGRGSGAASLVNYCLGVTNVDVLKHDLLFERFLNVARKDPPDIDVDFAWDEREDILDRVFDNYRRERVGRVSNHNRYDWRGAFRATARTLGHSDAAITRHLKESPSIYASDPVPREAPRPDAGGELPTVRRVATRLDLLRRGEGSDWDRAVRLSRRLVGIPHCLSMHCGGMIISPRKLCRTVPLVRSRKGLPTIQWEKDGAEDMGLVKIDLLGNRSLAVIRDAVRDISRTEGIAEDKVIAGDPSDDPKTRDLVRRGDTFGVFYLESPAMRLLMAKAGVGDFRHAVVHSSIIRPAANGFIEEYLLRLKGKPWEPEHEKLRGLFEESYGIPVYQEDVVKLTMRLCNYEYIEADKVRKALGRRTAREEIAEMFPGLKRAAIANSVTDEGVLENFERVLMSMTGYSFCKPHSASYAQVSFESAYLRAHYPAAFISAVLSNGGGYYSVQAYVSEAMRLGLTVLGPDVNASAVNWRSEGRKAVRTGLMAVSELSRSAMNAVVADRDKSGAYAGLDDFLRRSGLHAEDLRRLALVGALDSLAPDLNRPQLLWYVAQSRPDANRKTRNPIATPEGGSLFDRPARRPDAGAGLLELTPPPLPPYTVHQRRATEYSVLGFIPDCHPLALFADEIRREAEPLLRLKRPVLTRMSRLGHHVDRLVTVIAWPITAKIVETKKGDAMVFQTFEDGEGLCETVAFPEEFRKYHSLLGTVQPLWLTGKVLQEHGALSLQLYAVRPLGATEGSVPAIERARPAMALGGPDGQGG